MVMSMQPKSEEHEAGIECNGPCGLCDRIANEIGQAYSEVDYSFPETEAWEGSDYQLERT